MKLRLGDVANVAAVLVTVATLFASLSWISAGKAGGQSGDLKTAALGFMIMRLEAETLASNALVQAQTYLTQAGMYYAEADAADNEELKGYLTDLGDQSIEISQFQSSLAEEQRAKAQTYIDSYDDALGRSSRSGRVSDYRSTAALILNVSASVASGAVLFKRRALLLVFAPVFCVGLSYFVASFV